MTASPIDIARAAWGVELPDWIARLAEECSASSQNKVAARLGRSPALVSTVLRGKYKGDMGAVEAIVRDVLMPAGVNCPVLGAISSATCRHWMGRAGRFDNINSETVRMYRACNACSRLLKGKKQ